MHGYLLLSLSPCSSENGISSAVTYVLERIKREGGSSAAF
ncbi:hypothetical protein ES707_06342 [subsurface metagenome]